MSLSTAKKAILKAKIGEEILQLLVKTSAEMVYIDDTTTLAAKLAEILTDISARATTTQLTEGLAGKADKVHTHEQSEINGLTDALAALASTESMNAAIAALKQEMLGDTPVEAYNTFTELAAYIEAHQEVSDALNAAIGTKADKTALEALQAIVDGLGALAQLDKVSEDNLDDALKEKVNAAAEGNHSHANKDVIDGITTEKVNAWDAAEQNAKDYADGLAGNYDAKGSAAAAEQNAKDYADGLAGNYDAAGSAATAEQNAKAYADGLAGNYDAAGAAATAEQNAKAYADGLGTVTIGGAAYDLEIEIVE